MSRNDQTKRAVFPQLTIVFLHPGRDMKVLVAHALARSAAGKTAGK